MACQIILVATEAGHSIAKDFLDAFSCLTSKKTGIFIHLLSSFHPFFSKKLSFHEINLSLDSLKSTCAERNVDIAKDCFWVFILTPDLSDTNHIYHSTPSFLSCIGYIYAYSRNLWTDGYRPNNYPFAFFSPESTDSFIFDRIPFSFSDDLSYSIGNTYSVFHNTNGTEYSINPDTNSIRLIVSAFLQNAVNEHLSADAADDLFAKHDFTSLATSKIKSNIDAQSAFIYTHSLNTDSLPQSGALQNTKISNVKSSADEIISSIKDILKLTNPDEKNLVHQSVLKLLDTLALDNIS